ncbi:hypothetical protein HMPREF1861_01929 [Corynebacterium kroppenstedtii]|nr:hypothetical protein HMPREF1861_01929 [Corynebacterium kroppenstedtii]
MFLVPLLTNPLHRGHIATRKQRFCCSTCTSRAIFCDIAFYVIGAVNADL